jgi:hypothetical protein
MEEHRLRVSENTMSRRIFGHKRAEVPGENIVTRSPLICRYYSPNVIRMIKSRRRGRAGHVALMKEMGNA